MAGLCHNVYGNTWGVGTQFCACRTTYLCIGHQAGLVAGGTVGRSKAISGQC